MAKKSERKKCFVVGPIGADDSEDRVHADWLLEEIIEPVFAAHFADFDVVRADKIATPGRIDAQVISHLLESDLVIADITTLNPNAFYEIGIRHTVQKPIIHMHLNGQKIPFDIAAFRSIPFEKKRPSDFRKARELLLSAVQVAIDPDHEIDNPVTFSRGKIQVSENATPAERVYLEQLELINTRLETLESFQGRVMGGVVTHNVNRWVASTQPTEARALKIAISTKNTAPDADLMSEVEKILEHFPTAQVNFSGRGHAIMRLPNADYPKNVLNYIKNRLGEDFYVTRDNDD